MKYLIGITFLLITSCSTTTTGDPSTDSIIEPGTYTHVAERTTIGSDVHSVYEAIGYLHKKLHFFGHDSLYLEIKSDIIPENGQAKGTYTTSEQEELLVNIRNSNTTYIEKDSSLTFNSYKVVDESYEEILEKDSTSFVYEGPGLILQIKKSDSDDLDKDGDTTEMVYITEYFQLLSE